MRIVFVVQHFYPDDDSCANLVRNMAHEFICKGCSVKVLATRGSRRVPKHEYHQGYDIHRVNDPHVFSLQQWKREPIRTLPFLVKKVVNKLIRSICGKDQDPVVENRFYRKLLRLYSDEPFDVVISVSATIITSMAAYKLKKKHPGVCWCFYMADPYTTNRLFPEKEKKAREQIENRLISAADVTITTRFVLREKENTPGWPRDRVYALEFPNIRELKPDRYTKAILQKKSEDILIFFAGRLEKAIRPPQRTMDMFTLIRNPRIKFVVLGIGCEDVLEKYREEMPERLILLGQKPLYDSLSTLLLADVLVNIGNTVENQVPSKILDYLSTGKPIIHIRQTENCPVVPYLSRYPNALDIAPEEPLQDAASRMERFITCNESVPSIEYSMIKELYQESTVEYVANRIYTLLQLCVGSNQGD